MANLGTIATQGDETKRSFVGNPAKQPSGLAWEGDETKSSPLVGNPAMRLQSLMIGEKRYVWGAEDFIFGDPQSPCLRMDASGSWRFRWAMEPGTHSISVNVNHAINQNPRPSIALKANPGMGIPVDVEVFAPSGTGWVTFGIPSFNTTAQGATWVELRCNLVTNVGFSPCYWDHVNKV